MCPVQVWWENVKLGVSLGYYYLFVNLVATMKVTQHW